MNRYRHRLVLAVLGLALALPGAGLQTPAPQAPPVQVSLAPAKAWVKIVLEPATAVPELTAAYAADVPAELVVNLGRVKPPAAPAVPAGETLIRTVRVQPAADGRVALRLGLAQSAPFRVFSESGRAVVEIARLLGPDGYALPAEVQAELDRSKDPDVPVAVEIADRADRVDVAAKLGRKAVANVFALANPMRLVVDVYGAVLGTPTRTQQIGNSGVDQIKIGQFQAAPPRTVTRIVFELSEARPFTLTPSTTGLTISVAKNGIAGAAPSPVPAMASIAPEAIASNRAGAASSPVPVAPASDRAGAASSPVPVAPASDRAGAVSSPKSDVPKPGPEPPAAATKKADPLPVNAEKSVVDVPPAPQPQVKAEKTEMKPADPPAPAAAPAQDAKAKTVHDAQEKYSGALISPKFLDADLKQVVLWLGDFAGLNVVFDPEVRGTVTVSFDAIPWDQFLDIVLKINNQGKTLEGNVLRIAPVNKLAEEEKSQQALRDAREQSGTLVTRVFTLSYAKSNDVLELLKNKKSPRGEIATDARTNTVIVSDVKEKIDLMESLIGTLDQGTQQVQIEARIVEANSTFAQSLGIQWGAKGIADPFYGNQTSLQFPNKILVDGAMIPQGIVTKGIGGPLGGYAVNLPAPAFNSAIGLSFANVLDTFRLDVALSALESSGEGKIQSTERITTQNNKEGYVNQGRQIPVQTSANFTVTTQYMNAGLELRVTPQITAEGTIIMTLEIKNDAADFSNLVNGIPPITTQSAKTTVTVADGGTTVIGGVYRIEDSITRDRVPFLHQIPILGSLFKSFSKTKSNRELLIFITPRIQK